MGGTYQVILLLKRFSSQVVDIAVKIRNSYY